MEIGDIEKANVFVTGEQYHEYKQELAGLYGQWGIEELRIAEEFRQRILDNSRNVEFYNLWLGILFILISIIIPILITRSISGSISKLKFATKQIEKKNFKVRVDVKTGDELEELGKSFNETARVLEDMDKEHKQLEKAKTEFLSITSHELRSPMTPMQAQLQMLAGEYYGKLNVKQKNSLEIVARNTKRLDSIIVDFLEISRIEAARLKFRFAKGDPTKSVLNIANEMVGLMPEKKIKITTKIGKLPVIEYDSDRLGQVLRNLANNAIKFSKPRDKVSIAASLKGNFILFSVTDQGIGISAEDQIRLFEPFFQAEQTIYREHQGTGLGLAIVRGIVESQNGKVWIESKKDVGTTFYFTLPLKPVREIKPIKLLFSEKEGIDNKIKNIFSEVLGPIGAQEFTKLKEEKYLNKKSLISYIGNLVKKGILNKENGEVFKSKILNLFGEKVVKEKGIEKNVDSFFGRGEK